MTTAIRCHHDDLVVVGQELEFEEYQQCDGTDDEADQGDQPKQKPSWTVPDCGGSCQELDEYVARKLAAQARAGLSAVSRSVRAIPRQIYATLSASIRKCSSTI